MEKTKMNQAFLFTGLIMTSFILKSEAQCGPSGNLIGVRPPPGQCNPNDSECCVQGRSYPTYTCSPLPGPSGLRRATLTLNSFEEGGGGGGASACDDRYHSDDLPIVALSTGWFEFSNRRRCLQYITVNGNGRSVRAMVVDECDSERGCDEEHGYQPPCHQNIVDGSRAVWIALGVPNDQWGELEVTWNDA